MNKKIATIWTVMFLILTAVPISMELVAALDNNDNTVPWTILISKHVPWELALFVYAGLAVWVPVHFIVWYRKKVK
jgi:hypothetical protein